MKMLSQMSRQTDGAARESHAMPGARDPRAGGDSEAISRPAARNLRRWWAVFAILPFVTSLSGCGLMAAPCRVASAGLKIVPGVGGVLAAPTDTCAAVID